MKERTIINALVAISDKIFRLKGTLADAEKYAADPATLDKDFWLKTALEKKADIAAYEAAHAELLTVKTEPNDT